MFYLFLYLYLNFTRGLPSLFDNGIDLSDNLFQLNYNVLFMIWRISRPEVFLGKSVLEIFSKFTGEHPCQSVISVKLQSNFIEIILRHGCSPVNFSYIFRIPFPKNTSEQLLLELLRHIFFIKNWHFGIKLYNKL